MYCTVEFDVPTWPYPPSARLNKLCNCMASTGTRTLSFGGNTCQRQPQSVVTNPSALPTSEARVEILAVVEVEIAHQSAWRP